MGQLELDFMTSENRKDYEEELLALLLLNRGRWVKPSLIQDRIAYFRDDYATNEHNDNGRRKIRQTMNKLQLDPNTPYLIISSWYGYKIATEKEAKIYKTRLKISALKKWKMYWTFESKLALDGQLKMMYDGELKETIAHIDNLEGVLKNGY